MGPEVYKKNQMASQIAPIVAIILFLQKKIMPKSGKKNGR